MIYNSDNGLNDINILPFIKATNIVSLGYCSIVKDGVDNASMIHYKLSVGTCYKYAHINNSI